MDIQIEKYELLKWLINLEDVSVINKIKKIKDSMLPLAASSGVSEIEKTLIDSGIKEYEKGNTFSHHQVMEELKIKYGI